MRGTNLILAVLGLAVAAVSGSASSPSTAVRRARSRPARRSPGQPSVEFISPRNGAVQRGFAVVVKAEIENFRLAPRALRRRTAARRGQHPLQPQPRARLRRPGEAAAKPKKARSARAAWSAPPSTIRNGPGPTACSAPAIGSSGSYSPATRPEIFYDRLRPGFYRLVVTLADQRRDRRRRTTTSPTSRSSRTRPRDRRLHRRQGLQRQGGRRTPRGTSSKPLHRANTSLCIVRCDADIPPPDGLSAPLPPPALGLARLRLGGDGDDGPDPLADRPRRQRDRGGRPARPAAPRAGDRRRRDPAPRADRGAPRGRRQGLAGGRVRPAPELLRATCSGSSSASSTPSRPAS